MYIFYRSCVEYAHSKPVLLGFYMKNEAALKILNVVQLKMAHVYICAETNNTCV